MRTHNTHTRKCICSVRHSFVDVSSHGQEGQESLAAKKIHAFCTVCVFQKKQMLKDTCKHTHFQSHFISSHKRATLIQIHILHIVMLAAIHLHWLFLSLLYSKPATLKKIRRKSGREKKYILYSPCTYTLLNISSFSSATTSPAKWTASPLLCWSTFFFLLTSKPFVYSAAAWHCLW